ncbi:unnamed protein product [Gongylonema pulchrum]|uniref:COesterase domain-containing protein n=1 Tax=Gongylonema pulchrum TaxID=637853 RepID=A0A183CWQ9_9BILA|nr:unnamed protein product [Gongylonema pulchrum]
MSVSISTSKNFPLTVAADARPSRQTTHGEIQGYFMESSGTLAEVYEAVPYAQPPVASLRFQPPKPLAEWNETLDCGKDRMVRCIQFGEKHSKTETEDCLYLNIVIPRKQVI